MTADEESTADAICRVLNNTHGYYLYTEDRHEHQRLVREAFAIADRARAELDRLEEYQQDYGIEISAQSAINVKMRLLKRIIDEEGS